VQLVVVDLVPTLLRWESPDDLHVPDGAGAVLAELSARYRLAALADSDRSGVELRHALEQHDLAGFFEAIGTAAGFGPRVTPRVVRRMSAALGFPADQVAVVTARPELGDRLQRASLTVILTEGSDGFLGVPAAMEAIESELSP
jgi:hypothetical protein